ncbi:hypothetical protein BD779DRAFT_1538605 [Infundibulicybe gibba]|nr:hypothetical protein BD779DRAFT_1538605 [Infundibulicybe gibba]
MHNYPANPQLYPGSNRNDTALDYWHHGMPSEVVTRNHDQHPGVFFFPVDGIGHGVAMTECEYGQGMVNPDVPCVKSLPPELRNVRSGSLVITWPGYQTLKWKHDIVFVDKAGSPLTMRQMGLQISRLWRCFYEKHHEQFDGRGIRLGPTHVTMNHLRLHCIYTHNYGRLWQVEVSYILPN